MSLFTDPLDTSTTNYDSSDGSDVSFAGGSDGGDSVLTQLGGLFSGIGTAVSDAYPVLAGPATVKPGTVIVNPNGTTTVAGSSLFNQSSMGMFLIFGFAILVLFLLLRS